MTEQLATPEVREISKRRQFELWIAAGSPEVEDCRKLVNQAAQELSIAVKTQSYTNPLAEEGISRADAYDQILEAMMFTLWLRDYYVQEEENSVKGEYDD